MNSIDHEQWFAGPGGCDAVKGMLSRQAAEVISFLLTTQNELNVKGSVAEIGTYFGKTFVGLAKSSRPDEVVLGIDLYPGDVGTGFRESLNYLSDEQRSRVKAIRRDTATVSALEWIKFLATPSRFVHVDGGHNYKAIISDLHLVTTFLAPRAIVILDDFMHEWYPDLTEGIIDGLRASSKVIPIAVIPSPKGVRDGGIKLVCASHDGANEYKSVLLQKYKNRSPQGRKLVGHEVIAFQNFYAE